MSVIHLPPNDSVRDVLCRAATEAKPADSVFIVIVSENGDTQVLSSRFNTQDISVASVMLQSYAVSHALNTKDPGR